MNKQTLIDQLQESKRWNEFAEWYNLRYVHTSLSDVGIQMYDDEFPNIGFVDLHPDFQLGVFLSYMKSKGYSVQIYFSGQSQWTKLNDFLTATKGPVFNTPQEMILHFFNN